MQPLTKVLQVNPVVEETLDNKVFKLTTVEELPLNSVVTNHAIRRFRSRVRHLPRKSVIKILEDVRGQAQVRDGEIITEWNGCVLSVIVRNGSIVTVIYNRRLDLAYGDEQS